MNTIPPNDMLRFDELIEESRQLETQALDLQAGGPLNSPSAWAVQKFQERYRAWHAAVSELLSDDLRRRFEQEWANPDVDWGLAAFVADPINTWRDRRGIHDAPQELQAIEPTKVRYTYPAECCFRDPLLRLRSILIEAKYYPEVTQKHHADKPLPVAALELANLHPRVVQVAGALFSDGHYPSAVLQACTALTDAVKEKSGATNRDGTALMQYVFSQKKPVLAVSTDEGEQQGWMFLFSGAVMALRNPRAHVPADGKDLSAEQALEWLSFISALMRTADRAERVAEAEHG